MKKIFLAALLVVSVAGFAQTKQQDVKNLLAALQIKPTMQNMVHTGVNLFKSKKPAVPQQVWNDIENLVDYTPYLNTVTAIFNNNYTQTELKHLTMLATKAKAGKQPKFKPSVKTALYNAGNDFGKQLANLINTQLMTKGY